MPNIVGYLRIRWKLLLNHKMNMLQSLSFAIRACLASNRRVDSVLSDDAITTVRFDRLTHQMPRGSVPTSTISPLFSRFEALASDQYQRENIISTCLFTHPNTSRPRFRRLSSIYLTASVTPQSWLLNELLATHPLGLKFRLLIPTLFHAVHSTLPLPASADKLPLSNVD